MGSDGMESGAHLTQRKPSGRAVRCSWLCSVGVDFASGYGRVFAPSSGGEIVMECFSAVGRVRAVGSYRRRRRGGG